MGYSQRRSASATETHTPTIQGGQLILEQTGTAGFLWPALERAGVTLDPVPRRFYADACSALTPP